MYTCNVIDMIRPDKQCYIIHKELQTSPRRPNPSRCAYTDAWQPYLPFGDAWGLLEAICLMRPPWQLRATRREMMAVFPKPTLPTTVAPRLSPDWLPISTSSSCWNSQSRPTNTESVVMLGTSNRRGFSMISAGLYGANRAVGRGHTNTSTHSSGNHWKQKIL